jgi:hypothetical protein
MKAFLQRSVYLFYYLKETNIKMFPKSLDFASELSGRPKTALIIDAILSLFKYNTSLIDYFYFRFWEKEPTERRMWAGTGFMYEYQLKMNPRNARRVLENKIEFLRNYSRFIKREFRTRERLENSAEKTDLLLNHPSGLIVLKDSLGQAGRAVEVKKTAGLTSGAMVNYMQSKGYDLAEEYVVQHPDMSNLSPSGLNTVRIITQVDKGQVDFLGARLRISVNSAVDNMAAGNLAAPIDLSTGIVNGPGVYSDITKTDEQVHPITGVSIIGFQIPYWQEVCQMARDAALFDSRNRSVGWDIAITPNGPELIEGNHNWCKLLWQLPVKKGLKSELEKYL